MSCGKHHDVQCQEILDRVYFFIDHELAAADEAQISQHIQECAPCLDEVALERLVKALVARSCTERAPVSLRQRVVLSIRQVQVETTQSWSDVTNRPAD